MLSSPKITVLMPVYNCELYIREAVDSILNQTFEDFEFLIIDDASTDKTVSIIKTYNDPRIKLIEKPKNTGYTNSLNYALDIARGEFIARMDGDDISLPERFAKQVAFLDINKDVILCGTQYEIIGANRVCNHPLAHDEIKVKLLDGCYIAHPTVMFRRTVIEDFQLEYDINMEPAEDYDLWSRLCFLGKLSNLPEVLLLYRVYDGQTSSKRAQQQISSSEIIKSRLLQKLIPDIEISEVVFRLKDFELEKEELYSFVGAKLDLYNLIMKYNSERKIFDDIPFKNWINFQKKKMVASLISDFGCNSSVLIVLLKKDRNIFRIIGLKKSFKLFLKTVF